MKPIFLLSMTIAVALLGGCTGAYKSTQTPDDVYYSPVRGEKSGGAYYDSYTSSSEDNYLRMKVNDHYRWSAIDDYDYWNDSRYLYNNYYDAYGYNSFLGFPAFGYGSFYSPWGMDWYGYYGAGWNGWYNPWHTVVWYKNPKSFNAISKGSNLTAYSNRNYNNNRYAMPFNTKGGNTDNNGNFGSLVRKTFTNSNNNNNSNNSGWDRPVRTYSPGFTPSSSAGGRSGGYSTSGSGGGGSRPARGH